MTLSRWRHGFEPRWGCQPGQPASKRAGQRRVFDLLARLAKPPTDPACQRSCKNGGPGRRKKREGRAWRVVPQRLPVAPGARQPDQRSPCRGSPHRADRPASWNNHNDVDTRLSDANQLTSMALASGVPRATAAERRKQAMAARRSALAILKEAGSVATAWLSSAPSTPMSAEFAC